MDGQLLLDSFDFFPLGPAGGAANQSNAGRRRGVASLPGNT